MKKPDAILIIFFLCLCTTSVGANQISSPSFPEYKKALLPLGVDINFIKGDPISKIIIKVDQQTVVNEIPLLRKTGTLNKNISNASYSFAPVTLSYVVALESTGAAMELLYKDKNINKIKVLTYLQVVNNYGNNAEKLICSYDFNKNISNKVNWNKINPVDLSVISKNFKLSQYANESMQNESQYLNPS